MEDEPVVVVVFGEKAEVFDSSRRIALEEGDLNRAFVCLDDGAFAPGAFRSGIFVFGT